MFFKNIFMTARGRMVAVGSVGDKAPAKPMALILTQQSTDTKPAKQLLLEASTHRDYIMVAQPLKTTDNPLILVREDLNPAFPPVLDFINDAATLVSQESEISA